MRLYSPVFVGSSCSVLGFWVVVVPCLRCFLVRVLLRETGNLFDNGLIRSCTCLRDFSPEVIICLFSSCCGSLFRASSLSSHLCLLICPTGDLGSALPVLLLSVIGFIVLGSAFRWGWVVCPSKRFRDGGLSGPVIISLWTSVSTILRNFTCSACVMGLPTRCCRRLCRVISSCSGL